MLSLLLGALAVSPATAAMPCRILVTNDDGISSPGLAALRDSLSSLCDVEVVAPATDQSGASHSVINTRHGLVVREAQLANGMAAHAVVGTPAEATAIGLLVFGAARPFDLVVVGINRGENTGLAYLYSGTVNAGMEALARGTPAIAISQASECGDDFSVSAPFARRLAKLVLANGLPKGVMLNVNVPRASVGDVVISRAGGLTVKLDGFEVRPGAGGETLYVPKFQGADPSMRIDDVAAYMSGRIVIAPLRLDRTADGALIPLRRWPLDGGL